MAALEFECNNVNIIKSKIPLVDVISAECNGVELTFDIHRELNLFRNADKIKVEIFYEKPECQPDKDYCGLGYVFSISNEDNKIKMLISIGGYIIRILGKINHSFKPMDKVYVRIRNMS